jgi:hypothetical protein
MFQVCTGDGWSTDVVRPMFEYRTHGFSENCMPSGHASTDRMPRDLLVKARQTEKCRAYLASKDYGLDGPTQQGEWLAVAFFVSYIIVAGYFLLNIVVAVLLDEFVSSVTGEREAQARAKDANARIFAPNQLDLLMQSFSTYQSPADLRKRVRDIFKVLDTDNSGFVNYRKWQEGSQLLDFHPPILFSPEDWDNLIKSSLPGGDPNKLSMENFEIVIDRQPHSQKFCV